MTRTAVSPDEPDSLDPADPRPHAKRDLAPVWRHLRTRPAGDIVTVWISSANRDQAVSSIPHGMRRTFPVALDPEAR